MFIWSVRADSLKFIGAVVLCVVVIAALIIIVPVDDSENGVIAAGNINYDGVASAEDVISFLKSAGWEVTPEAVEKEDVTIPDEFDKVFINYNEIQKKQGLDLSKYKRKKAVRYTFEVTNYKEYGDYSEKVYANVIVYRGRVIAADICSASPDGFVHGVIKDA